MRLLVAEEKETAGLIAVTAVLIFTPAITFELLLAARLDGDNALTAAVLFIPVYIIEGMLLLLGCRQREDD